ncbi:MAG TPA: hypothetical protein VGM77_06550 [Gemmatimonadales bacterium]
MAVRRRLADRPGGGRSEEKSADPDGVDGHVALRLTVRRTSVAQRVRRAVLVGIIMCKAA